METRPLLRGAAIRAFLRALAAERFISDLSLYATFRRRPGGPGGSALGSSLFGRPY